MNEVRLRTYDEVLARARRLLRHLEKLDEVDDPHPIVVHSRLTLHRHESPITERQLFLESKFEELWGIPYRDYLRMVTR